MSRYVNVNDTVWVCITEYGWKSIRDYYQDLFSCVYYRGMDIDTMVNMHKLKTSEKVVDGEKKIMTEFQLHEVMNLLGPKMYCGAEQVIENNRIYFDLKQE